jgi:excisionase family DNA binding protein
MSEPKPVYLVEQTRAARADALAQVEIALAEIAAAVASLRRSGGALDGIGAGADLRLLPPVLTVAEAAKLERVSPPTIYEEIKAGKTAAITAGKAVRVLTAPLLAKLCISEESAQRYLQER